MPSTEGVIVHSPQIYKECHFLGFPMGQCHLRVGAMVGETQGGGGLLFHVAGGHFQD